MLYKIDSHSNTSTVMGLHSTGYDCKTGYRAEPHGASSLQSHHRQNGYVMFLLCVVAINLTQINKADATAYVM